MQLHQEFDIDEPTIADLNIPAFLSWSGAFELDALTHGSDVVDDLHSDRRLIDESIDHRHHPLSQSRVSSHRSGAQQCLAFPELTAVLIILAQTTDAYYQRPLLALRP